MKLVLATSHSEAGGATAIWCDLAEGLRARGHVVEMLALYPGRNDVMPLPDRIDWQYGLPHPPTSATDALRTLRTVTRLLRRLLPDAVLTALPAANVILPLANRLAGAPARVLTSHHSPVNTYNSKINLLDGVVGATTAVSGIVCVSAAVRASLVSRSARYLRKVTVVRNALPPSVEAEILRLKAAEGGAPPGRRLIATGRFAAQKNHAVLLRALAMVPAATLQLVGSGPDEAMLRSLAQTCNVADRVIFSGLLPRADTLAAVAAADVFLQPSLFEGHSLALVEAAKLGIPLIVSDVPSQIEGVTRQDGTICAMTHGVDDHRALAACLSTMLTEAAVHARYRALAVTLGQEISFPAMCDAYDRLLGQVAGSRILSG